MSAACGSATTINADAIVALLGAVGIVVGAVGALAVKVLANARDIQAAWSVLHDHSAALNGGSDADTAHNP